MSVPDRAVSAASRVSPRTGEWVLRVLAAAGLAVDAYVHLDLAGTYDANTAVISEGALFRIEAALAVIAAILVLLVRGRVAAGVAVLVAGGGLGAVLLYQYVDVGAFGPFPDIYEPISDPEKTVSTVAEAGAAVALVLLFFLGPRRGHQPHL
jgi:hypothetical protein